jgi:endo-1,4-beta-xylanase
MGNLGGGAPDQGGRSNLGEGGTEKQPGRGEGGYTDTRQATLTGGTTVRSSLSSTIVAVAGSMVLVGCGKSVPVQRDGADSVSGTGGTVLGAGGEPDSTGTDAAGGTPATGGSRESPDSGGTIGSGGVAGTEARIGTGGTVGTGGTLIAVDGGLGTGGASSVGGTIVGHGGGPGGAAGDRTGAGGAAGAAGTSGSAGATATGGVPGSGGTTGLPSLPPRFFGNTDTRDAVRSDFVTYWDQLTPENVGEWASVQGISANTFSWSRLDATYKYCEENNIIFKEHCFVWGAGQASWINDSNAVAAVQSWMKTFCDRYPKTRLIDVVNEPLHYTPRYANGLRGEIGATWDWIVNSFKWAREACPNAVLILNDYNIIEYSSDHSKLIDVVKTALAAGAPIMAIGAQGHDVAKVPLSTVQAYVANIVSQTGLPVYITALDLGIHDDNQQATTLKDFVTTFWNDPSVPGITYWGYIVGATWRDNTGLMTSDGIMRPAMTWLMDFLGR